MAILVFFVRILLKLGSSINFLLLIDNSGPINYKKLVNDEILHPNKERITVNLPSILKDNSVIHKNNPFTFCDKDIVAVVKSNTNIEVGIFI